MDERIQKYEDKMKKTLHSLESGADNNACRTCKPTSLDKLTVDYYGSPTPLQQVGNYYSSGSASDSDSAMGIQSDKRHQKSNPYI